MLKFTSGNLLEADVEALVNTVNTVGVMGKGIALQFKQAFPSNYRAYRRACDEDRVVPGTVLLHDVGELSNPRYILNFPTKRHWRSKSRLTDIEAGLVDLRAKLLEHRIGSVAVPPLGCGNGGLDWDEVRPLIVDALSDLETVEVLVFAPDGPPPEAAMPVRTSRPVMTSGRAALIVLAAGYDELGLGVSQIEIQKLMYFLQERGEALNLHYAQGTYGPYADTLNHVLERMEGHFIRGFGDRTRSPHEAAPLTITQGSVPEARSVLEGQPETRARIETVLALTRGFESPYGLELLATLHWLWKHGDVTGGEVEVLRDRLRSWSERKGRIFRPEHIRTSWDALERRGWVTAPASV